MCFFKNYFADNGDEIKAKKQKAKEDIVCYKELRLNGDEVTSWAMKFNYKLNKKYKIWFWKLKEKGIKDNYGIIHIGFHSYQKNRRRNFDRCKLSNMVTYKCIIPKGSYYFQNTYEYVSNQIIIKEKI